MTMLDDDRLASLFARAGAAFEVPVTGPDDIVARASGRGATTAEGAGDGDHADETDCEDTDTAPFGQAAHAAAGSRAPRGRRGPPSPPALGRRLHRGPAGAGRRGGRAGAQPGAPGRHGRAGNRTRLRLKAPVHAPSTTTTTPAFSSSGLSAQAGSAAGAAGPGATSSPGPAPASAATPQNTPKLPSGAVGQSAKIEQTGSLTLTVGRGKLNRTVTQLTALAGAYGGFVANSQTQSGTAPSGSVTLQVPVNSFATVLKHAQALGKTSDLATKATDVTGQYVDLQARITALQASRQQYLTILAKATTVGDVLAVQEQIDAIQSQIEQLQGQLQLLTSQTSYSTLTVTVERGHAGAAAQPPPRIRPRTGVARQHRRLRHRRRRCHPHRRPAALRAAAARRAPGRRARPLAALSAPQPLGPRTQAPMAAANGMPGMETTPKPAEGPASSLTAIGPEACTKMGSSPTAASGDPDTISTLPAATVPVATTWSPDVVGANAL